MKDLRNKFEFNLGISGLIKKKNSTTGPRLASRHVSNDSSCNLSKRIGVNRNVATVHLVTTFSEYSS